MKYKAFLVALLVVGVLSPSRIPQVQAAPLIKSTVTESQDSSYAYPSDTTSGISGSIPENAAVVEIGYGSDDHDWFMGASQGHFFESSPGVWAVQDDGGITSSNGNERRGVFVQFPARQNSYITQWGWASSHTSGGHGGTDNYPVDVCVDARYRMFDPVTHQLTGPEIESGNCSSRGYADPSWVRGIVRADNGKFLTNVWQFQFGNDAKLHGAKLTRRTLIYGSYDATPQNPLPLRNPLNIG